ncbi:TIM23 complex component [Geranomyces variabilis]|uniref:Presequence translocated-associated motor subunit PAM17 n=1 Tax=Geranomyces variabilis TaxID=109894 RepID=A0AAD5TH31_9FUNG|nr:TIM23 complex component [Geranomyces variabilis]
MLCIRTSAALRPALRAAAARPAAPCPRGALLLQSRSLPLLTRALAYSSSPSPSPSSFSSASSVSNDPDHDDPLFPADTTPNPVTWDQYFALRKSRRNWERSGGIVAGAAGLAGGGYYFGTVAEFDPTIQIMSLDPTMAYALAVIVVAGAASAAGTLLFGQLWRLKTQRSVAEGLDVRDRVFQHLIKTNRPQEIPIANPIPRQMNSGLPDYYGEKIDSVDAYRDWRRKQRLFVASKRQNKIF